MANSGDASFWLGEWPKIARRPGMAERAELLRYQLNGLTDKLIVFEPCQELRLLQPTWVSFKQRLAPARVANEKPRVVLHCRQAGHGRDAGVPFWDGHEVLLSQLWALTDPLASEQAVIRVPPIFVSDRAYR